MGDTPQNPQTEWEARLEARRQRHRAKIARRAARWEAKRARWEARGVRLHGGMGSVVVGLIFAAIGVLLLLQNLGIIAIGDLWDYWPVILIVIGLSRVVDGCTVGGRVWGGVIAGIGTLFLLRNLGILHANLWALFWPSILIAIGVGLLLRAFGPADLWRGDWHWDAEAATDDSSTLHAVNIHAVFSHAERFFDTQQFEGGEIAAVFGGVELDLTKAAMAAEQVNLECNAVFGGVDIRVPETWRVLMRGTGVFGGFSDETHPPLRSDAKTPMLVITGGAVFGGVNVKN